jgi:hypothetical protein
MERWSSAAQVHYLESFAATRQQKSPDEAGLDGVWRELLPASTPSEAGGRDTEERECARLGHG